MATHITFVYHHRGWLEKDADGVVMYNGGLVSIIDRVHVDTCNLFLVEGLFLDLGYSRYNEVYWLEPGMDLANELRVLRRDADVIKLCDAALKNKNRVHLYFEYPVDADPELVDEVEGLPSEDQQNHDENLPQHEEQGGLYDIEVDGTSSENQENHQGPTSKRPVGPTSTAVPDLGVPNTTRTLVVSNETMNGASKATTSRFSKFMPNQSG